MQKNNLVIIGSGPAAYTAAIYAARAELKPILFEGFKSGIPGGQLMTTTTVENFPGFPDGIFGQDLMEACKKQSQKFGTTILTEDVLEVDLAQRPYKVKGSKTELLAESIIVATGATAKTLKIPGADTFWQKGVSACAICDGAAPIFRNQELFVVGGGDSACEEALFLTKFASMVHIVHRRAELKASQYMVKRVLAHPKINIIWNSEVIQIKGDKVVQEVVLQQVESKKEETKKASGLFFAIGHQPASAFLKGQLEMTDKGYIITKNNSSSTNKDGVFAVGDVQDSVYRQAITAAGSGCMGALDAERWLSKEGLLH